MKTGFFAGVSSEQGGKLIQEIGLGMQVLVFARDGKRVSARMSARDDGDLMDRIGVREGGGDEGVTTFMVGDYFFLARDFITLLFRSGPRMTFSMERMSSSISMVFLSRRVARIAASLTRFARSAPENPGVR